METIAAPPWPSGVEPSDLEAFDQEMKSNMDVDDIDMVVAFAPSPITFWLEVGSFLGASAILTTGRLLRHHDMGNVSTVCVDMFQADFRQPPSRRKLVLERGLSIILPMFVARVAAAGLAEAILPVQSSSTSVLTGLPHLLASGGLPELPQVIYLDSSHEYGETLLEVDLAWGALASGGVLWGDDWDVVGRPVAEWAARRASELDNSLGDLGWRRLERVQPGLFVTPASGQFYLRKRGARGTNPPTDPSARSRGDAAAGPDDATGVCSALGACP